MKTLHPFSKINNSLAEVTTCNDYQVTVGDKSYLDAISGLYNCPLGYSSDTIKTAIFDATNNLPSSHIFSIIPGISQTNIYLTALEDKLKQHIPFAEQLYITNSGSEAVDSAIGLCKLHSGSNRHKVMSYSGSYHGSTRATLSASGNLSVSNNEFIFVDFYSFYDNRSVDEYLDYIEGKIKRANPEKVLAFIAEPMIGASGGFFMKENILPKLKTLLNKYGIYLILDEVISGFGRLGEMFAWKKYNVIPDVLIVSKAITNGYMPLGCCVTTFKFDSDQAIAYGYTMAGHPISCAAALASIDIIRTCIEDDTISELSNYVLDRLEKYDIESRCYKIDSSGLFIALHFSQYEDRYVQIDAAVNKGAALATKIRERGIITRGNPKSLIISPGYLMSKLQIDNIIKTISDVL
jgi:adenosylmethionine-8-amino-7-oxononanoate aminotransferase